MKLLLKQPIYALAFLASFGMVSCSDDDSNEGPQTEPAESFEILSEDGNWGIAQFDTLKMKPSMNVKDCRWVLDGKEVASTSDFKLSLPKTGSYVLELTAAAEDGTLLKSKKEITVAPKFSKGTFILNEGNMGDETGTLTFIDEKGMAIDSAYYRVNGKLLGNVCQDMFIADGKMYVISQNGPKNGGEGLLTVMNADNLEKIEVFNDDAMQKEWPSNIAVVDGKIYVRTNAGLFLVDLGSKTKTKVADRVSKARMAVADGKVFAISSKKLLVIEGDKVVKEIEFKGNLSGVAKSYDGKIWASCTGPNKFLKIDSKSFEIIDEHDITEGGLSAGWGVAPAFSAVKDTLYYCNGSTTVYRHIFEKNVSEKLVDVKESVPTIGMYYNSLGVNPVTGVVCFASMKGYGMDYKINDIALFDFNKEPALQVDYKSKNSFPAGVFYTYNFE